MKRIALALLALALPMASCSAADPTPAEAAEELALSLRETRSVEFYFLSRTEDWNYSATEIIENASIQVRRSCGRNCHHFMEPVLAHLRDARPFKCQPGQQDGLIRGKPGHDLIYDPAFDAR
jgi:hypothetical protein